MRVGRFNYLCLHGRDCCAAMTRDRVQGRGGWRSPASHPGNHKVFQASCNCSKCIPSRRMETGWRRRRNITFRQKQPDSFCWHVPLFFNRILAPWIPPGPVYLRYQQNFFYAFTSDTILCCRIQVSTEVGWQRSIWCSYQPTNSSPDKPLLSVHLSYFELRCSFCAAFAHTRS